MNDKAFFQLIAVISFVVGIVFMFTRDSDRWSYLAICGGLFFLSSILSVAVGRKDPGPNE